MDVEMKLRVWSDIHLDVNGRFKYKPIGDESEHVLVLAGDILSFDELIHPIRKEIIDFFEICDLFKQVIFVPGNHEYYNQRIDNTVFSMETLDTFSCRILNDEKQYQVLSNDYIIIDDVKFIGSTLWSKIRPEYFATVSSGIRDFQRIVVDIDRFDPVPFTVNDCNLFHNHCVDYLQYELGCKTSENVRNVVITHFMPFQELQHVKYALNLSGHNDYFQNNLSWMLHKYNIDTWIYGHTHDPVYIDRHDNVYRISTNGTRIVSNPRGYFNECVFDPYFSMEV